VTGQIITITAAAVNPEICINSIGDLVRRDVELSLFISPPVCGGILAGPDMFSGLSGEHVRGNG